MMTMERAAPDRRARVRALLLAAAKDRARDALAGDEDASAPLFAPFSPSPHALVAQIWDLLSVPGTPPPLAAGELLVDLGCGDGRWLFSGVERFGCSALGVEIDAALVARGRAEAARRGLEASVQVLQGDILSADISHARLVIVYAFAEALPGIRDHLHAQLPVAASVLSIGVRPSPFPSLANTSQWLVLTR